MIILACGESELQLAVEGTGNDWIGSAIGR
jgi:hypothetical protein